MLARRVAAGDEGAFEELWEKLKANVERLILRMLCNWADVEDARQMVMLQVWRRVGEWRGDAAVSSWAYRVACNQALMLIRKQKLGIQTVSNTPETKGPEDRNELIDTFHHHDDRIIDIIAARERLGRVRAKFRRLSWEKRQVWYLREVEGLNSRLTAAAIGINEPGVKSRLHRARLELLKVANG